MTDLLTPHLGSGSRTSRHWRVDAEAELRDLQVTLWTCVSRYPKKLMGIGQAQCILHGKLLTRPVGM